MPTQLRAFLCALALSTAWVTGCGGGGNGGGTTPSPSPTPQPPVSSSNPCASVSAADEPVSPEAVGPTSKRDGVWGDTGWSWIDAVERHRAEQARRERSASARTGDVGATGEPVSSASDQDIGDVAVLEDGGDLVVSANPIDLGSRGLRFTPSGGGYGVTSVDATFRTALGTRLTLGDDDTASTPVPFGFPFYGSQQSAAFVNSDGNITFGAADTLSTARNITRLLSGPPRIAPFFADLDPSAGGSVWVNAAADAFTVTYCSVRGFESAQTVTAQATLLPDGVVEFRFATISLTDAVVGVSPGQTTALAAVDLTAGGSGGAARAVAERFSATKDIDLVAVSRRLLAAHGDTYDQVLVWTDQRLITDAFSYEITVRNDIRGIGVDLYDESADFGGTGRLSSVVMMDALTKFPDDPSTKFLGENNVVSVLGQEVGHRWLAFMQFRDVNRQVSQALLGRDLAHWSFFMDSDASVMEGNDIEDLGGGSFRTVGAVSRYSRLDQYAMGLAADSEVPPFFYVESPVNTSPSVSGSDAAPRTGVTFNGTRRDVRVQDIIDVLGARQPGVASAPKTWRQAFVYVVSRGNTLNTDQVAKLDRFRRAWETFYASAVDGRARVDTRLKPGT